MEQLTPRGHRALFGRHRASGINTEGTSSKESVLQREGPKPGQSPTLLVAPIHRSAWKGYSPKLDFRFTAFSEVRIAPVLCGRNSEEKYTESPMHTLLL